MQHSVFNIIFVVLLFVVFANGRDLSNNTVLDIDNEISNVTASSSNETNNFTTAELEFQRKMLNRHNSYRSRHCAQSLELDDDISRSAQKYAEEIAEKNAMMHSGTEDLGENLYEMISSAELTHINGTAATDSWYDEIEHYNFDKADFSSKTGHFTQVVWNGSRKLGVGYALGNKGHSVFVVAQYSPQGNILGQFETNVSPPKC